MSANVVSRVRCWWDGFYATWFDPGTWAARLRLMLRADGVAGWPYIVESGHLWDTEHRQFQVIGQTEHEWVPCARCGKLLYSGWRHYYGTLP